MWRVTTVENEEHFFDSKEKAIVWAWMYFMDHCVVEEEFIKKAWVDLITKWEIDGAVYLDPIYSEILW